MPARGKLTMAEKLAAQYIALGMGLPEVAQTCDITLPVLKRTLTHPLMAQEIDRCRARAFPALVERLGSKLEQLQEPALDTMGALLRAESEAVQFQSAKDLLNRGPLGTAQGGSGQAGGMQITLDHQALSAILAGALNMGHHGILAAFASLGSPGRSPDVTSPDKQVL